MSVPLLDTVAARPARPRAPALWDTYTLFGKGEVPSDPQRHRVQVRLPLDWHALGKGIAHTYIMPRTPRLNGNGHGTKSPTREGDNEDTAPVRDRSF
ncbi:hypothetical protein AB0H92_38355 [Streptomyces phaeochromogenes]|uniref:hypothetical protein n=1 Tax=Streptomyces phaeochromogenes TaxID=1923 RepID=UPI0034118895